MPHLLTIADSSAPPGVPVWVWIIFGGIVVYGAQALWNVGKAILSAGEWKHKVETTHDKPTSNPPTAATLGAQSASIDGLSDALSDFREEQRGANKDTRDMLIHMHGRLIRVETLVDPNAPPMEPTGSHGAVKLVK